MSQKRMSSNPQYFQTKINATEMPPEVSHFREANLLPRGAGQIQIRRRMWERLHPPYKSKSIYKHYVYLLALSSILRVPPQKRTETAD